MPNAFEYMGTTFLVSTLVIIVLMLIRLREHIEAAYLARMLKDMPENIEGRTKRRLLRWISLEISWTESLVKRAKTHEEEKEFAELAEWLAKVNMDLRNDCPEEGDIIAIRAMLGLPYLKTPS